MNPRGVLAYQKARVTTNDAPGILLQLLDGVERFVRSARVALENKREIDAMALCMRAHAITEELSSSLDHKLAPELAAQLTELYRFAGECLLKAAMDKDVACLDDAWAALEPVVSGFREAVPKARSESRLAAVG